MKKHFFFAALVAASMLASCSSDDVVASQGDNAYGMVEGQPAFLSLGIAMPGAPASRANDDVQDGDDAEFAVKSGRLVLFKGTTEATAKLVQNYDITDYIKEAEDWTKETSNDQITTSSKKVVVEIESPKLTGSEKLFAYVILNDKGNDTGISYGKDTEFPVFSKKVLQAIGIADETKGYGASNAYGLVMTSVPVCTAPGNSQDPSLGVIKTLSPIDATAVYPTKAEADKSTAKVACCYVERAAVKVQTTFNANIEDPADKTKKINVTNVKWGLGNVNGKAANSGYYNTRQVDAAWSPLYNKTSAYKYRFVSGTPLFASGHEDGYRTFFGQDVNYSGNTGLIGSKADEWPLASGGVTYTYENTFDEDSQIYANTTYVSLKVELNGGADFYTIDGDNNNALDQAALTSKLIANVDAQIHADIAAINSKVGSSITADLGNPSGVLQAAGFTGGETISYDLVQEITYGSRSTDDGSLPYTSKLVFKNLKVDATPATSEQKTAIGNVRYDGGTDKISDKLGAALTGYTPEKVYEYTDGVAYYATRIAHFYDDETYWSAPDAAYNDYSKIYPTSGKSIHDTPVDYGENRAAAWLGRWGIVRNNWYKLTVSDVQGIGDAEPVDYKNTTTGDKPGLTPDDNPKPKYYIAAHVHILPWILREQKVEL